MIAFWHDLRFATRVMRKSPGATIFALVALSLGIGVNTSVFCILANALWRPLPVPRTDEVVAVVGGTDDGSRFSEGLSYADYADLRDGTQVFTGLVGFQSSEVTMNTTESRRGGAAERTDNLLGEFVTGNYFDVLEVNAALGRTFTPGEGAPPTGEHVVVLSHSLWQRRFGGDANILGRTIHLNSEAFTVIGVAPSTFKGTNPTLSSDFWIPIMVNQKWLDEYTPDPEKTWLRDRTRRDLCALGRLRPGVDMAAAQANVQVVWRRLVDQFSKTNKGATVAVVPEPRARWGNDAYETVLGASVLAQVVAGLVLLVACANVANLLLARAAGRAKEIAIRQALGASRGRLVRQLMTESLLLALMAGALGLLVASWCGDLFIASAPRMGPEYAPNFDVTPDLRAMAVALGISVFTGCVFGIAPALRTSQLVVVQALKTDAGATGQSLRHFGLRQALVVAQVSISMVVVLLGALFVRSLRKIEAIDPGFRPANVTTVLIDPGMLDYRGKRCVATTRRSSSASAPSRGCRRPPRRRSCLSPERCAWVRSSRRETRRPCRIRAWRSPTTSSARNTSRRWAPISLLGAISPRRSTRCLRGRPS